MWPDGKIPYTYHWSIERVPSRRALVERAIQSLEQDSCLEFQDITDVLNNHLKGHKDHKKIPSYFHLEEPPAQYPSYIL